MQLKTLLSKYEGKAEIRKGSDRLYSDYIATIYACADCGFYTSKSDYDDADEANKAYASVEALLAAKVVEFYINIHGALLIIVK